ncbi:hypothetical protein O181_067993 [Austropuccinia psidii MF-1]|uniref:Uncharacterized protein n=1 Tax=Austropuccinia psidii MF-1 TaxID=1389203 RepID=A0A9Q3I516_9BASI|nr:hypothetical protein [Austropuccinia psidii MF-1]
MPFLNLKLPPDLPLFSTRSGNNFFLNLSDFLRSSFISNILDKITLDQLEASLHAIDQSVENKKTLQEKQQNGGLTTEEEDWLDQQENLVEKHIIIRKLIEVNQNCKESISITKSEFIALTNIFEQAQENV